MEGVAVRGDTRVSEEYRVGEDGKFPLAYAEELAGRVVARLAPLTVRQLVVGSVRRKKEWVRDVEVVVEPRVEPAGLFGDATLNTLTVVEGVLAMGRKLRAGERYVQVEDALGSGMKLDVFLVHPPATWGVTVALRTGSAEWNMAVLERMRGRMVKMEDGRLTGDRGQWIATPTEGAVFRAAGMRCVDPEEREVQWFDRACL